MINEIIKRSYFIIVFLIVIKCINTTSILECEHQIECLINNLKYEIKSKHDLNQAIECKIFDNIICNWHSYLNESDEEMRNEFEFYLSFKYYYDDTIFNWYKHDNDDSFLYVKDGKIGYLQLFSTIYNESNNKITVGILEPLNKINLLETTASKFTLNEMRQQFLILYSNTLNLNLINFKSNQRFVNLTCQTTPKWRKKLSSNNKQIRKYSIMGIDKHVSIKHENIVHNCDVMIKVSDDSLLNNEKFHPSNDSVIVLVTLMISIFIVSLGIIICYRRYRAKQKLKIEQLKYQNKNVIFRKLDDLNKKKDEHSLHEMKINRIGEGDGNLKNFNVNSLNMRPLLDNRTSMTKSLTRDTNEKLEKVESLNFSEVTRASSAEEDTNDEDDVSISVHRAASSAISSLNTQYTETETIRKN